MKKQILLTTLLLFSVLLLNRESLSQEIVQDLKLSLAADTTEINISSAKNIKVSLNIKNVTEHTVKFRNIKIYLELSGKDGEDCSVTRCLFAFVQLNAKKVKGQEFVKLKSQEFIEVDAELDSIHWYNGMASHFTYSTTKNLFDKVKSGEYNVSMSVEVEPTDRKDKWQLTQARSNKIKIAFR